MGVDEFMDKVEVACIDEELYPDKAPKINPSPALRSSEVARMSMQRSLPLMLDDLRRIASGTLKIP